MAKSILITGCSSGIGLDAALTLQKRGYKVFASARKPEDVNRLQQLGVSCYRLDLDEAKSIENTVTKVLAETGGTLDALFNNGAYGQVGAVEDLPDSVLRAQFETNVFGWHQLVRLVVPVMRRQGHGRIIQNSSILGVVAMPYRGAYIASKYAIEGLTDTLRLELAGSGIYVSLIEPGPINTRFRANALVKFKQYIDIKQSVHHHRYQQQLARLEKTGNSSGFTLQAKDVTAKVIAALESKHPKVRYPVTVPSFLFILLKRLLPSRLLDKLLARGV
ncbi:SDR family oxidoreductase [Thalassomonas sp. RHCl1]|uniref:SDR family oxidoreductase n=1 Tax=Thalassomonas sp. RHCl1 TaxID=2995320 RepID=UPI00248B1DE8|nr:SDR family oxidoreductase [Thalassomonas sp. RHCl1]